MDCVGVLKILKGFDKNFKTVCLERFAGDWILLIHHPTTAAEKFAAATQKLQCLTFGLTQRYELLHNAA